MIKAYYDSGVTLTNVSPDFMEKIKADLTFENPAYAQVQKFSKYSYTKVPPYLTYYQQKRATVRVPIGYNLSEIPVTKIDRRVCPKVEYPPFMLTLRKSQEEAVSAYLTMNKKVTLNGSIQMPTGKGKSILGLYLAQALSVRTLIVVHKDDLVTGWKKDIELAFGGKVNVGLIKAKNRRVGHTLTIATVQTLNRLSTQELEELYDTFGLVIQDEMHHCPASSFAVVSNFNARYKLGLTATPERNDGLSHIMNLYFGGFCYRYKAEAGDTDILPVKVIVKSLHYKFNPVCEKGKKGYQIALYEYPNNYVLKEGQKYISEIPFEQRPTLNFQTVDDYTVKAILPDVCKQIFEEYKKGHSCVVFFTQKEHCRLCQSLLAEVVPVEDIGMYYGDNKDNDSILKIAEQKRKFITITTYAKATEGTNVKQWEVEFLVSSINNEKNTEQAVGRIRRAKEGKLNPVILYDYRTPFVYTLAKHGNTRDRRYKKLGFIMPEERKSIFSRGY